MKSYLYCDGARENLGIIASEAIKGIYVQI